MINAFALVGTTKDLTKLIQLPQRRHQALQGAGDDARQEEGRRGEGAELLFLVV